MLRHPPEIEVLHIDARGLWTARAGTGQIRSAPDLMEVSTWTKVKPITLLAWRRSIWWNLGDTFQPEKLCQEWSDIKGYIKKANGLSKEFLTDIDRGLKTHVHTSLHGGDNTGVTYTKATCRYRRKNRDFPKKNNSVSWNKEEYRLVEAMKPG